MFQSVNQNWNFKCLVFLGNVTSTSSEIAESSTAEEDGAANEDDDPQDLMEVDDHQQPNVTANPGMNWLYAKETKFWKI